MPSMTTAATTVPSAAKSLSAMMSINHHMIQSFSLFRHEFSYSRARPSSALTLSHGAVIP